jgi:nucleotide-binding universal stress UspA family protein
VRPPSSSKAIRQQAIMRVADEHQADLIVLGTHGRTGCERLLLGSVARNVMVHAPISVLVVRPAAEAPAD